MRASRLPNTQPRCRHVICHLVLSHLRYQRVSVVCNEADRPPSRSQVAVFCECDRIGLLQYVLSRFSPAQSANTAHQRRNVPLAVRRCRLPARCLCQIVKHATTLGTMSMPGCQACHHFGLLNTSALVILTTNCTYRTARHAFKTKCGSACNIGDRDRHGRPNRCCVRAGSPELLRPTPQCPAGTLRAVVSGAPPPYFSAWSCRRSSSSAQKPASAGDSCRRYLQHICALRSTRRVMQRAWSGLIWHGTVAAARRIMLEPQRRSAQRTASLPSADCTMTG